MTKKTTNKTDKSEQEPERKPNTLYAAALRLLAIWPDPPPYTSSAAVKKAVEELGKAVNRYSQQRSDQVNRENVGRPQDSRRAAIAEMLLAGKTGQQIAEATKASAGLIQNVRDALREEEKLPLPPPTEK